MSTPLGARCSICGNPPTYRDRIDADDDLYDVTCPLCGIYRIGTNSEAMMAQQSPAHRTGLVRMILSANARGNRYCINDGREIQME